MKMTKMTLPMEQTPYHIERNVETNAKNRQALHTDVSPEVYHDFMMYVENTGLVKSNGDPNKSKALSDIVLNFLNNNVFEQKVFRKLNVILLLPRNCNPDELKDKCKIVGFIDGNDWLEITLANIFYGGGITYPLRHNFMYNLREFNEYNYKSFLHYFNVLYKYDETIFFNVDKETQQDFESVKKRLSELYQDIDVEDAYFVMFTFNNYLDVLQDGVFRSKTSALEHEGVIVLLEDLYEGVFACLKWSYLQGELSFELEFDDVKHFEKKIAPDLSNPEILIDFRKMSKTVSPLGKLEYARKITVKEIAYLEEKLEVNKNKLKDIDEELSQYTEDAN